MKQINFKQTKHFGEGILQVLTIWKKNHKDDTPKINKEKGASRSPGGDGERYQEEVALSNFSGRGALNEGTPNRTTSN